MDTGTTDRAAEATSNCADLSQPGVPAIVNYLKSLPRPVEPNCDAGHYYILNNYNPGFNGDGSSSLSLSPFTIPGTSVRHIGDALLEKNISWKYYGDGWDVYCRDPDFRQSAGHLLQHLQSVPVRNRHHDQRDAAHGAHPGHAEYL